MSTITRRPTLPAHIEQLRHDGLSPLLARVYAGRGVATAGQLRTHLDALAPPEGLRGIERAAEILADAIIQGRRILVVADFDCDGATSCALSIEALRLLGAQDPQFLVPDRFRYGYGLTPEIVELACGLSPAVLMTVDNGISSVAGVAAAKAAGMQIIVTDHHLPGPVLPDADAIVNPNQPDCPFPWKNSAGVGVAFYVMLALRSRLRAQGYFHLARPEPKFAALLDLLALGTVADVVPLDDNNRILVAQGLARMNAGRARPGIAALLEVGGRVAGKLNATDLGFVLGPRLNAAGRLADMSLGIRCLLCRDAADALQMAQQLDALNRERRAIEADMQTEAQEALLLDADLASRWGVTLYNPDWHQGVIGIIAGRIKDQLHKPVIAFARVGEDEIKGSARSIRGLHMRDALDAVAAAHPGLLNKFGGHAMAAGLSLRLQDLPQFMDAFDAQVRRVLRAEDLQGVLETDGELFPEEISLKTAALLASAGPWGQGFPEPLFDGIFALRDQRVLKDKHLRFTLQGADGQPLEGICFNALPKLTPPKLGQVRLVYIPEINEFRGEKRVQLKIVYFTQIFG